MLQVRENEISLREWSAGGTAQLRTLEVTLYGGIFVTLINLPHC